MDARLRSHRDAAPVRRAFAVERRSTAATQQREGQTAGQWVLGVLGEGCQVLSDGAPGLSLKNSARAAAADSEGRACDAMATSTR